jgi:hypothetical protein
MSIVGAPGQRITGRTTRDGFAAERHTRWVVFWKSESSGDAWQPPGSALRFGAQATSEENREAGLKRA